MSVRGGAMSDAGEAIRGRARSGRRPAPVGGKEVRRQASLARRAVVAAVLGSLLGGLLAACSSSGGTGGRVTLNFYNFPDDSGAIQAAADNCTKASGGRYKIKYNKLPRAADGQRQQMVRRLAAHDKGMDILGLDVTWEAEFAEAGWIREWTGANKTQAEQDTLKTSLE